MINSNKVQQVEQIAAENPKGFTVSLPSLAPLTNGIVVAYQATQNSHGKSGLLVALNHAYDNGKVLGGWYNSENDKFYYDSCKVFENMEEALRFGREQKQIAIYDLNNDKVVFC